MPPRRGRGRGSGASRPPQAVRNAMTEIGMGSLASYEMMAQAVARANLDAARGYFPELDEGKKAKPENFHASEVNMAQLFKEFQKSMQKSPHFVVPEKQKKTSAGVEEIDTFGDFFYGKTTDGDKDLNNSEHLWDQEKHWIIPELIPLELIPHKARSVKEEKTLVKKVKTSGVSGSFVGDLKSESVPEGEEDNVDIDTDGKKGGDDDQVEEDVIDDDADDLELDADYQTGMHFDDDDGYEEQDSGAEEATF